jgi:hypothetical protein
MAPIDDAIAAIKCATPDEDVSYRKIAVQFNNYQTTWAHRHQGHTNSNAGEAQQRTHLNPQQERELVIYVQGLTEHGLPPKRTLVKNMASEVAKTKVSERWEGFFFTRNSTHLSSKWTTGIDCNPHIADSEKRYRQYFEYLHSKMQEYEVEAENVYNMDEKCFTIGTTACSKCMFSKQLWQQKRSRQVLQDGSREWITVLACVCADGFKLPPGIIFES